MGLITVVYSLSSESIRKTIIVSKNTKKWFKRLVSIIRIMLYLLDVGLDILAAYIFLTQDWQPKLGQWQLNYGLWTISYIVNPIIATAIFYIVGIVRDTKRNAMMKIRLVVAAICFAPIIPLYILIKAAIAVFNDDDPDNKAEDDSARVRLLEAMLETLPQAFLQTLALQIQYNGEYWLQYDLGHVPPITNLDIFLCVKSIFLLSFSVATSAYLFKASVITRGIFFICGSMALISRFFCFSFFVLIANKLMYFPGVKLLAYTAYIPPMIVWIFKRVCKCNMLSTPLSYIHHESQMGSMFHVVVTWCITSVFNCFTISGLLMSMIALGPAIYMVISIDTIPLYFAPIHSVIYLTFAAVTVFFNLWFVLCPICSKTIGNQWLNKDENGGTWMF